MGLNINGTVLLAGLNPIGQPQFINGTYLVAALDSDGQPHILEVDANGDLIVSGSGGASLSTNNPANIGYAPAPGSGTAASKDDHVHDTVLTVVNNTLAAPVTTTTANTYYDGPAASLVAGIWLVVATVSIQLGTTPNPHATSKLWDGTNVFASTESGSNTGGYRVTHSLSALITLLSTTTIKVSVTNSTAGGSIMDAALAGGTPAKASQINAVRVG